MQKEFFLHQVCHQWLLYVLLLRLWPIMMTGFHKYTIFVVVVLVDFTPLFKLFGGPFSFHHANDVQRLWWTYSSREDLYTPSFGNFQDKKIGPQKNHRLMTPGGVYQPKILIQEKTIQSIPFQPYPTVNPIQSNLQTWFGVLLLWKFWLKSTLRKMFAKWLFQNWIDVPF